MQPFMQKNWLKAKRLSFEVTIFSLFEPFIKKFFLNLLFLKTYFFRRSVFRAVIPVSTLRTVMVQAPGWSLAANWNRLLPLDV